MKEKILKLRAEGKSYKEISKELGCSKSAVCYHCGIGQKEKSNIRLQKRRKEKVLLTKVQRFKKRKLSEKARSFQRRNGSKLISKRVDYNFTIEDIINKIGNNPICYLTGKSIDLNNGSSYQLDHIIPSSRGGSNELENAGILRKEINLMKNNFTIDELLTYCIEILEYNGYNITKK